jgi:hypothetical protein
MIFWGLGRKEGMAPAGPGLARGGIHWLTRPLALTMAGQRNQSAFEEQLIMIREIRLSSVVRATAPYLGPIIGLAFIVVFGIFGRSHAGFLEKVFMTVGVAFLADRFFHSILRIDRLVRGRFNVM